MVGFITGMIISFILVWGCKMLGIILHNWDWWFFFIGVVTYARIRLMFYRHEFRSDMRILLKTFHDKFDKDQQIFLLAASGIVLPPILFSSEIEKRDPALLQIFSEVLNVILLIASVIYRQYHITVMSVIMFISGYGFWLWQFGPFYSGRYYIDAVNGVFLYLQAKGEPLSEFREAMITTIFRITTDMFYYGLYDKGLLSDDIFRPSFWR